MPAKIAVRRPLLTRAQAAEILNVPERNVKSLQQAGELTPTYVGRLVRYRPEEIDRYIEEHTGKPQPV